MSTLNDASEQWAIAAGRHPFIRPPHCTFDDHDTTDPFCERCGKQLNDVEPCDECRVGDHDGDAPYCPCCGARQFAVGQDGEHQ